MRGDNNMVIATQLLEQIAQEGNGVDMVSRFAGPDGWPPSNSIPNNQLTNELGHTIGEVLEASPRRAFNEIAPDTNKLDNLISPPTPTPPEGLS